MRRATCCLVVPLHPAAIVISVLGVIAGAVFGVGYAVYISNATVILPGPDQKIAVVPYVGMGSWVVLAIISFFGLIVCWKQHAKLAAVYFWLLFAHYIFDLGVLVANIVVTSRSANQALDICQESLRQSGITGDLSALCTPISPNVVIFLAVLGVCKLIATYTTFVIFQYKRWSARQAEEKVTKEPMNEQQVVHGQQVENGASRNWSKFED
jgi:hypothetical protein